MTIQTMVRPIEIHAGDWGRYLWADFTAELGADEILQTAGSTVTVVHVRGETRDDVTAEFFAADDGPVAVDKLAPFIAAGSSAARTGERVILARRLREPAGSSVRRGAAYEILFRGVVAGGVAVIALAARLSVLQTGRADTDW